MTIKQLQTLLENYTPSGVLCFTDYDPSKQFSDYREFISNFLSLNDLHTNFDEEDFSMCGKNRSISDVYKLTKNYYPDVEFVDVFLECITNYVTIHCPDIKKRVITRGYNYTDYAEVHSSNSDEYGLDKSAIDNLKLEYEKVKSIQQAQVA